MAKTNYRDYSLSYGEDIVASELINTLNATSKKQYSIYAPLSRQEKGIDLLIRNNKNGKTASFQVKESRIYKHTPERWGTFFNSFNIDEEQKADFYALITMYPYYDGPNYMSFSAVEYKPLILIFTYEEMKEELDNLTGQRGGHATKFYHEFKAEDDIELTRGFKTGHNTLNNGMSDRSIYLLKNKKHEIINILK